jgi:hypothetical protein
VDIAHGELVEKELAAMIERRHDKRVLEEGECPPEEQWQKAERRMQEKRRIQARYEWHAFHCDQAERHRRTLQRLIEHHEQEASKYEPSPGGVHSR